MKQVPLAFNDTIKGPLGSNGIVRIITKDPFMQKLFDKVYRQRLTNSLKTK